MRKEEVNEGEWARLLGEMSTTRPFKAQEALEDHLIASYTQQLISLAVSDRLATEYAELQGKINSLKMLKARRRQLVEAYVQDRVTSNA